MTPIASTNTNQAAPGAQANGLGQQYQMFLKLLTTQLQNQDPLEPMKTAEYTQQLAQFSQVEQALQQTAAIKDLASRLTAGDLASASTLVGRQVALDTPANAFDGSTPIRWDYGVGDAAKTATADILGPDGRAVTTVTLDKAGQASFSWDGTTSRGTRAAPGVYTLAITAKDANGQPVVSRVESIGIVQKVLQSGGSVSLDTGGTSTPLTKLTAVLG